MGRSSRAAEAVTSVAYATLADSLPADPLPPLLEALRSVVGADVTGFYHHEWHGWTTAVQLAPSTAWRIVPLERAPTSVMAGMHPGIAHLVRVRPTHPFAVTDVVPEREWVGSELFAVMRADWGRNQQFALPVTGRPGVPASDVFVLGRMSGGGFTALDREISEALLPVLTAVALHRDAVATLRPSEALSGALTARELAVLGLLADGMPAPRIAVRLGMAPRTAQKHLEHVYRKLGVHSGGDAVRLYRSGRDPVGAPGTSVLEAP
jgi:DNA-binding CsgD family transcriptional regulator